MVASCQLPDPNEVIKELKATQSEINAKRQEINEHLKKARRTWLVEDPNLTIAGKLWATKRNQLYSELSLLLTKLNEQYESLKRVTARYDQLIQAALKRYDVIRFAQKQGKSDPVNICRALRTIERDTGRILKWSHSEAILGAEKTSADFVRATERVLDGIRSRRLPEAIFKDVEGLVEDPVLKGIIGEYGGFMSVYAELGPESLGRLTQNEQLQKLIENSGHIAEKLVDLRKAYKAAAFLYSLGDESENPFAVGKLGSLTSMVDLIKEMTPEALAPVKGYLAFMLAVLETFDKNFQAINFEDSKKNLDALVFFAESPAPQAGNVSLYRGAPYGLLPPITDFQFSDSKYVSMREIEGEYDGPPGEGGITIRIKDRKKERLTFLGTHKDWEDGFYDKDSRSWIFWRYPTPAEIGDHDPLTGKKTPDWVKKRITRKDKGGEDERGLHWLLEFKVERKGPYIVLEGDWYPGTVKWEEEPVRDASYVNGDTDVKGHHFTFKKITCP